MSPTSVKLNWTFIIKIQGNFFNIEHDKDFLLSFIPCKNGKFYFISRNLTFFSHFLVTFANLNLNMTFHFCMTTMRIEEVPLRGKFSSLNFLCVNFVHSRRKEHFYDNLSASCRNGSKSTNNISYNILLHPFMIIVPVYILQVYAF